jgi:hypothetical protein
MPTFSPTVLPDVTSQGTQLSYDEWTSQFNIKTQNNNGAALPSAGILAFGAAVAGGALVFVR